MLSPKKQKPRHYNAVTLFLGTLAVIVVIFTLGWWWNVPTRLWGTRSSNGNKNENIVSNNSNQNYDPILTHPDNPYPVNVVNVHLGSSLLDLKRSYSVKLEYRPKGETLGGMWSVELERGPFIRMFVHFDESSETDPKVRRIAYYFRDEKAAQQIREQAEKMLSGARTKRRYEKETILGETVSWDNVNGIDIEINDTFYTVSSR
jgi:hypothetical protein